MSFKAKGKQKPLVIFKNSCYFGAGTSPGQQPGPGSWPLYPYPLPSQTSEGRDSKREVMARNPA